MSQSVSQMYYEDEFIMQSDFVFQFKDVIELLKHIYCLGALFELHPFREECIDLLLGMYDYACCLI